MGYADTPRRGHDGLLFGAARRMAAAILRDRGAVQVYLPTWEFVSVKAPDSDEFAGQF